MSKVALSGNASGTGTFTIASPNSNTDRTLTLPDASGTLQIQVLTTWTITESGGVLFFAVSGVNKAKLDASGNLTVTGNVTAYGTV